MTAVVADLFIRRLFLFTICIANGGRNDPFKLIQKLLHSPETATGKIYRFHDSPPIPLNSLGT